MNSGRSGNHAVVSIGDDGGAQHAVRVGYGSGVETGFGIALVASKMKGTGISIGIYICLNPQTK